MEVKIGVQHAARELSIDTTGSAEDVMAQITAAISEGSVLSLADSKGRKVLVPVDKLAYVEIVESESRPLGFGRL
ncbi:MAG: DUF3107 domain-containing protein [Mycobacteriales bacterium]